MKYRELGRSGIRVSEVGVGGHREGVETQDGIRRTARFHQSDQQRAGVVGTAIDAGATYFDSTYYCEIESLGRSLRILKKRDAVVASGMRVDFFANYLKEGGDIHKYVQREVEQCLHAFGFDYVDQFLCGAMEQGDPLSHPARMADAMDELSRLRQQGKIRLIGFSTHEPDYAARLLEAFPAFETAMVPYNFANRSADGKLAEVVRRQRTALIAMKTHVWHIYGIPVTALRNLPTLPGRLEHSPDAAIGRLALQFVLANPIVSTCVPAINNGDAARENTSASGLPLDEQAVQILNGYAATMIAEDFIPLAIAGLHEQNGRVLAYSLRLLADRLKLVIPEIDWAHDDAEAQARGIAAGILHQLKQDPRWSPLVRPDKFMSP